jgi:quercetin dioxygenase-like cupin family protein
VTPFVVAIEDVPVAREPGDTAETRVVFSPANGCERLEQRVVRFARGRSRRRLPDRRQELLYVVSGRGALEVDGRRHALEPGTAARIAAGQEAAVENRSAEPLTVVSVLAPQEQAAGGPLVARFDDCPEERADEHRTFRVLLEGDVTQFVGIVQPCRAPDHSHPYDEVGYLLEGRGFAHVGGASIPIGPGSCFHLPPGEVHCIENAGPGTMRILGVFHPSGSPRQRSYEGNKSPV